MKQRMLKVVPNPYSAIDQDGRPSGAVTKEGLVDHYVGATVDAEETAKTRKFVFKFDTTTVVEVPATNYYRKRIVDRELLPADEETAKYLGIEKFEAPSVVLEKAHAEAQTNFENTYGRVPTPSVPPPAPNT